MAMAASLGRHVRVCPESACSTSSSCHHYITCSSSSAASSPQLAMVVLPSHRSRSSSRSGHCKAILEASSSPKCALGRSGMCFIVSWEGRSHLGRITRSLAGRHRQSGRGSAGRVHASLFGVGAPEALVIGVVALVVFGPKGLAEVARTLGKSLKAFQPTIQELQQVSREFKNTLEQEIGLDEIRNPRPTSTPPTYQTSEPARMQNGARDARGFPSEEYVNATNEQSTTDAQDADAASSEAAPATRSNSASSVTAGDDGNPAATASQGKSSSQES